MARTIPQAPSDHPTSSTSNAISTGRISKTRSDQSSSRSHMTRQRSSMLKAGNSSAVLQNMVDEAQDVIASSSNARKGKGRAEEESVNENIDSEALARASEDSIPSAYEEWDMDASGEFQDDDEDPGIQQALLDSVPANEVCPIIDKDDKPFPLMNLPAEIRLEIYRACLTRPYDILLSKRDKPQRREPETRSDNSGLPLSNSSPDADETEEDRNHSVPTSQAAPVRTPHSRPPLRPASSLTRRSPLAHGLRSAASRTARSIRLVPSRSAPGPSTNQNGSDNTSGLVTQAGASQAATGNSRWRYSDRAGSSTASRLRAAPVPVNEPPRNQSQDPLLVSILRVSKEVYKEARSVLYNENKFNLDLNTAMSTLSLLHQRSRRQIKHVELEIPTYNEILERFQETVRLSLRYCTGLKTFVIHMPFTLPGADGSGTTGNTTVYANGFDILRWLPQECNIIIKGKICSEIEVVVNKHLHLAKTLDKVSHEFLKLQPMLQPEYEKLKSSLDDLDKENFPSRQAASIKAWGPSLSSKFTVERSSRF